MKTSHRAALAAGLLAVLLTASGCTAPTPAPTPTVTVTVTPTADPAPTPSTPTSTAAPAPSPTGGADVAGWQIGFGGIGPFEVGDTLADARQAAPVAPDSCRAGVDTYAVGGVYVTVTSGIDNADPAAAITLVRLAPGDGLDPSDPQPRTAEGIGLGSSIAELQAARPDTQATQGPDTLPAYQLFSDGRVITFQDFGTGTVQLVTVSSSLGVATDICGA